MARITLRQLLDHAAEHSRGEEAKEEVDGSDHSSDCKELAIKIL